MYKRIKFINYLFVYLWNRICRNHNFLKFTKFINKVNIKLNFKDCKMFFINLIKIVGIKNSDSIRDLLVKIIGDLRGRFT